MKVAIPTNDGTRIISDCSKIEGFKIFEIENGSIQQERHITNLTTLFPKANDPFDDSEKNNKHFNKDHGG